MSEKSVLRLVRQHSLSILVLLIATLGFIYGLYSVRTAGAMPTFFDAGRAEAMRMSTPPETEAARKVFIETWNREFNSLVTPKWKIHDRGLAWIIFSFCLLLSLIFLRLWRPNAIRNLSTPRPLSFAFTGLAAYLSLIPITVLLVSDEAERELLPVWGDSIGLAIAAVMSVTAVGLPFALVVLWMLARLARQRASLWIWESMRPFYSSTITGLAAVIVLGLTALVLSDLVHGPGYALPTLFSLAYLTLAARAVMIAGSSQGLSGNN